MALARGGGGHGGQDHFHLEPQVCPALLPKGRPGAGGRGLHSGGGADLIGTGREGEWDRHTLSLIIRGLVIFGGVALC